MKVDSLAADRLGGYECGVLQGRHSGGMLCMRAWAGAGRSKPRKLAPRTRYSVLESAIPHFWPRAGGGDWRQVYQMPHLPLAMGWRVVGGAIVVDKAIALGR